LVERAKNKDIKLPLVSGLQHRGEAWSVAFAPSTAHHVHKLFLQHPSSLLDQFDRLTALIANVLIGNGRSRFIID
jgi:hypothetical protein